jgi:putative thiamine transport system permease protein
LVDGAVKVLCLACVTLIFGLTIIGLISLGVWSFAGQWGFGTGLPTRFSAAVWMTAAGDLAQTALISGALALITALIATILAFGLIGHPRLIPLIYLPLVLPQVAFLPGLSIGFLQIGLSDTPFAVILMHLVFVLPYAVLSLSGPARALDPRFSLAAASLSAAPSRIFLRVTLPLLLAPVLTTLAVSFAVALAQYLPTLLAGGGRIETLTTEAVALASGGDRRLAGAYGILQLLLPALAFALATLVPRFLYRNRAGLRGL